MKFQRYRFDLVFSYWVFAWWLLYMAGVLPAWTSPLLALIVGAAENIILLLWMIWKQYSWRIIALFVILNATMKGLPIWTLIRWQHQRVHLWPDLPLLAAVFCVYIGWVLLWGRSISGQVRGLMQGYMTGQVRGDNAPGTAFLLDVWAWVWGETRSQYQ
jgi:amino acid transporter